MSNEQKANYLKPFFGVLSRKFGPKDGTYTVFSQPLVLVQLQ
jgi:hypothetical protein